MFAINDVIFLCYFSFQTTSELSDRLDFPPSFGGSNDNFSTISKLPFSLKSYFFVNSSTSNFFVRNIEKL